MLNTPQSCENGAWQDGAKCGNSTPVCSAGVCVTPPSCLGLPTNCGPNADESCCANPEVPGGTYDRSNDMSDPATVSDFRLDRFEITVGRFRQFVAAYPAMSKPAEGAGANPLITGSGWQSAWDGSLPTSQTELSAGVTCASGMNPTWTATPGNHETLPMNCISWYEAFAFCAWDGGRLPTEAEWNYAAAGGSDQRMYPWGDTAPDSSYAVYCPASPCTFNVLTVGSKPNGDGKYYQADMAGSMYEWNLDTSAAYQTSCINCADLPLAVMGGASQVIRGGSWFYDASQLLTSQRMYSNPAGYTGDNLGARCAR